MSKSIYIISNPAYPNRYKVGIATNVKSRLSQYQTSDPNRAYKLEYSLQTPNARNIERAIHQQFDNQKEWVQGEFEDIKKAIEQEEKKMNVEQLKQALKTIEKYKNKEADYKKEIEGYKKEEEKHKKILNITKEKLKTAKKEKKMFKDEIGGLKRSKEKLQEKIKSLELQKKESNQTEKSQSKDYNNQVSYVSSPPAKSSKDRAKKDIDLPQIMGLLRKKGFECTLSNDKEVDFIACNKKLVYKVKRKTRSTFYKAYQGKDIYIVCRENDRDKNSDWYLYNHDKLVKVLEDLGKLKDTTKSWGKNGSWSNSKFPKYYYSKPKIRELLIKL